jgi:transcriptional regulator with XRE-family HTH domain
MRLFSWEKSQGRPCRFGKRSASPRIPRSIARILTMKTISERLKTARQQRGWTQAHLATCAGVSTGTVANIETGIRQAKGSLPQIAEALGVRHKWLSVGEGNMFAESSPTKTRSPTTTESVLPAYSQESLFLAACLDGIPDPNIKRQAIQDCVKLAIEADQRARTRLTADTVQTAPREV